MGLFRSTVKHYTHMHDWAACGKAPKDKRGRQRIHFKILLLVYKCLNGLAPTYLSELLRYTNGPRLLRSSSQNFLAVPRTRLKT